MAGDLERGRRVPGGSDDFEDIGEPEDSLHGGCSDSGDIGASEDIRDSAIPVGRGVFRNFDVGKSFTFRRESGGFRDTVDTEDLTDWSGIIFGGGGPVDEEAEADCGAHFGVVAMDLGDPKDFGDSVDARDLVESKDFGHCDAEDLAD